MKHLLKQEMIFPASLALALGFGLAAYGNVYTLVGGFLLAAGMVKLLPVVWRGKLMVCVVVCLLSVGYFQLYDACHQSALQSFAEQQSSVAMEGEIDSPIKQDGDLVTFYLLVRQVNGKVWGDWPRDNERIVVRVKLTQQKQISQVHQWNRGDSFMGRLKLSIPESGRNPGGFDYARFLRWQGVYVIGSLTYSSAQIGHQGTNLRGWFDQLQQSEAGTLEQIYPDPATAGYMKSLLLGVTDEVEPGLHDLYSRQGLLHVLAISGLHVTLVSACWMWIMKRLGLRSNHAMVSALCFLVVYVLLVGASSSAVRSGIMGGLGLVAISLKSRISTLTLWGISFVSMLICNPFQLWQAGFQLSFAVTLGLLVFVPMLEQIRGSVPRWIYSSIMVTLVAQLVSFPLLIYWFHQFSLLSWVINLFYVPIISFVILPLGYVSLTMAHVHPALSFFASSINTTLLELLHDLLGWLDERQLPFQHWPHPTWVWLLSYLVFCGLVPFGWYRGYHRRRDLAVYIICWLILVIAARQPFTGDHEVRITFLDVGQGDSIVVEVGREKVYLIDSGGTNQLTQEAWRKKRDPFEVGKDVVLPFLRSRGIERIDTLVMTHPDNDHVAGFLALLPHVQIGSAWVNGEAPKEAEQQILAALQKKQVPILTNHRIVHWADQPEVEWTWLSPVYHPDEPKLAGNDASIVLLLTAYGKRILFTGDLEYTGEKQIVKTYPLPCVDMIKIGHHGSKTSTSEEWLKRLKPATAVISVGKQNRYHHPHPEVIQRLKSSGTSLYRTDQQGAITVRITPEGITCKPFLVD